MSASAAVTRVRAERFTCKRSPRWDTPSTATTGDAFGFVHRGRHDFWVTKGEVGTPTHLAFQAGDVAAVDAFYKAALAAGGKDNGPPGPREEYGYAAFVLDPDGHNIEAVIWDEELKKRKPRSTRTAKRGRSSRRSRRKARRS